MNRRGQAAPETPIARLSTAIRRRAPLLHPLLKGVYRGALWSNPFLSPRCLSLPGGRTLDLVRGRIRSLVPDFVVIGAHKAGTSSLYEWLGQHPQIFLSSPIKEPGYWLAEAEMRAHWARIGLRVRSRSDLLRRYMARGYRGERRIGEASTYYTIGLPEERADVPSRLHQAAPRTRLIYLVRHPLGRIVSAWLDRRQRGETAADLDQLVAEDPALLATSLYARHVIAWRRHFLAEQLLVLTFEDLVARPLAVLAEIATFLRVEKPFPELDLEPQNRSENRADFGPQELRFAPRSWERVCEPVRQDMMLLESTLGRSFGWDLAASSWLRE